MLLVSRALHIRYVRHALSNISTKSHPVCLYTHTGVFGKSSYRTFPAINYCASSEWTFCRNGRTLPAIAGLMPSKYLICMVHSLDLTLPLQKKYVLGGRNDANWEGCLHYGKKSNGMDFLKYPQVWYLPLNAGIVLSGLYCAELVQ